MAAKRGLMLTPNLNDGTTSWPSGTITFNLNTGFVVEVGGTITMTVSGSTLDISGAGALQYKIAGTSVVKARKTGWTLPTASPERTSFGDYGASFSDPPTQAECDALGNHVSSITQRLSALITDLHGTSGHGLIGT